MARFTPRDSLFVGGLVLLLPLALRADAVTPYVGYTRPGAPNDRRDDGKIVLVSSDAKLRPDAIGGTVYYLVLERKGDDKNDPWGSGLGDLASRFKRGVDSRGVTAAELDREAKYLYLFQVINDRGTDLSIQNATVKLQADLKKLAITSWGSFHGAGFALKRTAAVGRAAVLPASASNRDGNEPGEWFYRSPSPAVPASANYALGRIPTRGDMPPKPGGGVA